MVSGHSRPNTKVLSISMLRLLVSLLVSHLWHVQRQLIQRDVSKCWASVREKMAELSIV